MTQLPPCSQSYYDVAFLFGPFDTSNDNYEKYERNYLDYCDIDTGSGIQIDFNEYECVRTGTRWTIVYKLCFAVALIFTFNGCIMTIGAWNYQARMLGSCLFTLT